MLAQARRQVVRKDFWWSAIGESADQSLAGEFQQKLLFLRGNECHCRRHGDRAGGSRQNRGGHIGLRRISPLPRLRLWTVLVGQIHQGEQGRIVAFVLLLDLQMARRPVAKEVGMGNPAEETTRHLTVLEGNLKMGGLVKPFQGVTPLLFDFSGRCYNRGLVSCGEGRRPGNGSPP